MGSNVYQQKTCKMCGGAVYFSLSQRKWMHDAADGLVSAAFAGQQDICGLMIGFIDRFAPVVEDAQAEKKPVDVALLDWMRQQKEPSGRVALHPDDAKAFRAYLDSLPEPHGTLGNSKE